jgi:hypothetical protein
VRPGRCARRRRELSSLPQTPSGALSRRVAVRLLRGRVSLLPPNPLSPLVPVDPARRLTAPWCRTARERDGLTCIMRTPVGNPWLLSRLAASVFLGGASFIGVDAASAASSDGGVEQAPAEGSGGKTPPPAGQHDELCPWGRLADGRGTLVRCLNADDARALVGATRPGLVPADSRADSRTASGNFSGVDAAPGAVIFEGYRLSSAAPALALLKSSYQSCVAKNGGLSRASGELRVRFHVDSHGVTREASVSRRRVLTNPAAQCIARTIEHRFVGVPTTGATIGTLVIRFARGPY